MDCVEFEIKILGVLKYPRLVSLGKLRKTLNSFDYALTVPEAKTLLDSILNNTFTERFGVIYKYAIDEIFEGMSYNEYGNQQTERNFPDNWIPPIG